MLACSASRHGVTEAVVAAVIGSYAYNMTMSLGVGALVAPIEISDSALLHGPLIAMLVLMPVAIVLGWATRCAVTTRWGRADRLLSDLRRSRDSLTQRHQVPRTLCQPLVMIGE